MSDPATEAYEAVYRRRMEQWQKTYATITRLMQEIDAIPHRNGVMTRTNHIRYRALQRKLKKFYPYR